MEIRHPIFFALCCACILDIGHCFPSATAVVVLAHPSLSPRDKERERESTWITCGVGDFLIGIGSNGMIRQVSCVCSRGRPSSSGSARRPPSAQVLSVWWDNSTMSGQLPLSAPCNSPKPSLTIVLLWGSLEFGAGTGEVDPVLMLLWAPKLVREAPQMDTHQHERRSGFGCKPVILQLTSIGTASGTSVPLVERRPSLVDYSVVAGYM